MLLVLSGLAYHVVEVPARAALSAWVDRRLGGDRRRVADVEAGTAGSASGPNDAQKPQGELLGADAAVA